MVKDELSVLPAFLAVAEERSFTRGPDGPQQAWMATSGWDDR